MYINSEKAQKRWATMMVSGPAGKLSFPDTIQRLSMKKCYAQV